MTLPAYAQLAILQQQNGDILEAIETYKAAIKLKPDYSAAYFNLGTAHENAGDLGSAIEQYQTAISLEGDPGRANPRFHSKLASALVEAGHLEREVSLHFDDSRHCRPLGERCKHDFHSLGVARELDASFFFNVAMVYLDTYLTFQPMPILLHWSQVLALIVLWYVWSIALLMPLCHVRYEHSRPADRGRSAGTDQVDGPTRRC